MHFKISSAKWLPFCLGVDVLNGIHIMFREGLSLVNINQSLHLYPSCQLLVSVCPGRPIDLCVNRKALLVCSPVTRATSWLTVVEVTCSDFRLESIFSYVPMLSTHTLTGTDNEVIIESLMYSQLYRHSYDPILAQPLQWRHNERNGISNHQPHDCLLNRLFKAQIKENIKAPHHWPLRGELTGCRWFSHTKGQ